MSEHKASTRLKHKTVLPNPPPFTLSDVLSDGNPAADSAWSAWDGEKGRSLPVFTESVA